MQHVVLTAVGRERPGIVAGVTEVLFRVGANLEDTSMCILCGHFAMLLFVSLPEGVTAGALRAELAPLEAFLGVSISLGPATVTAPRPLAGSEEPEREGYLITVMGADRPGIVYRVARAVADGNGTITDLNTRLIGAPDRRIYVMMLEVEPLPSFSAPALEERLGRLQEDLGVEIRIRPLEAAAL